MASSSQPAAWKNFTPSSGASRPVSATSIRHWKYSRRVIHSRQSNLRVIQPARPIWSGCRWVTITRVTGLPPRAPAKALRQAWLVSLVWTPVSTTAQPSPSAMAQTLMNCSEPPSGMRSHRTPGATSTAWPEPCSGAVSNG